MDSPQNAPRPSSRSTENKTHDPRRASVSVSAPSEKQVSTTSTSSASRRSRLGAAPPSTHSLIVRSCSRLTMSANDIDHHSIGSTTHDDGRLMKSDGTVNGRR
ncbi:hypothetical protein GWI33_004253 [Rhynchophorus ferrugineus]|uniref:Uncharacterized protein n=1 Tax=Rhynchophorus ferrugineus TaxID=354439 RepID=A0A834MKL1_RHYFE|nr:hypothetical protein GWI33_004253 [Rhynchophorus ferrugineus]